LRAKRIAVGIDVRDNTKGMMLLNDGKASIEAVFKRRGVGKRGESE
jgi:hypothetical protein